MSTTNHQGPMADAIRTPEPGSTRQEPSAGAIKPYPERHGMSDEVCVNSAPSGLLLSF